MKLEKKKINNKIVIIIGMIISVTFLAGYSKISLSLLDNKKLIDLNLAIQEYDIGNSGDSEGEADGEDSYPEEIINRTYTIEIRYKTVKCNNVEYNDSVSLGNFIAGNYKKGDMVYLVDDYAESHKYKEIKKMLEELKKSDNINYGER